MKPTIKEVDGPSLNVVKTLQRSKLWEVQTPQVIRPSLLREGFELVKSKGLEVTDDVRQVSVAARFLTMKSFVRFGVAFRGVKKFRVEGW